MPKIQLNGMTWGHSRGITPLLAFSQRFSELYSEVEVVWKKRSLQEFADFPIEKLAEEYDLLIVDHPWVGCAAATNCVIPLDEYLTETYLNDQLKNSTGLSHLSYHYQKHQWALAIDAAAPVASYRADLLEKHKVQVPKLWDEVISLAKDGKVAVPSISIDLLMNFYMFCISHGKEPFQNEEEVIDRQTGLSALETMKELYSLINKEMFNCNPIAIAEMMTKTNDYWYCPFAYGYSNYSRMGYADSLLTYTDMVSFNQQKLRSTLGGTGLAISSYSKNKEIAVQFAQMIVSVNVQSGLYVENGGQPGHIAAWKKHSSNSISNNFFINTLPTLERAYVRPRYSGYLHFQDTAGRPLQDYLRNGSNPEDVLLEMNKIYQQSFIKKIHS